jgi:hypothetical protein
MRMTQQTSHSWSYINSLQQAVPWKKKMPEYPLLPLLILCYLLEKGDKWLARWYIPYFYRKWWFKDTFTNFQYWTITCASSIKSTSSGPIFFRSIFQATSHQRSDLESGFFSTDFLAKILYGFLICSKCAVYPTHFVLLNSIITLFSEE